MGQPDPEELVYVRFTHRDGRLTLRRMEKEVCLNADQWFYGTVSAAHWRAYNVHMDADAVMQAWLISVSNQMFIDADAEEERLQRRQSKP
jgi:hypothetical protein